MGSFTVSDPSSWPWGSRLPRNPGPCRTPIPSRTILKPSARICGELLKRNEMNEKNKPKPHNTPENTEQEPEEPPQDIPPEILDKLPEKTKRAIIQAASFSGPLPPPALYAQYEEILPGSAERMMAGFEREQSQRHDWDNKLLDYQAKEISRGQWMAFGLGALAILGAIFCAYIGQPWVAGVLVGTSLVGIVTTFIKGRSNNE